MVIGYNGKLMEIDLTFNNNPNIPAPTAIIIIIIVIVIIVVLNFISLKVMVIHTWKLYQRKQQTVNNKINIQHPNTRMSCPEIFAWVKRDEYGYLLETYRTTIYKLCVVLYSEICILHVSG